MPPLIKVPRCEFISQCHVYASPTSCNVTFSPPLSSAQPFARCTNLERRRNCVPRKENEDLLLVAKSTIRLLSSGRSNKARRSNETLSFVWRADPRQIAFHDRFVNAGSLIEALAVTWRTLQNVSAAEAPVPLVTLVVNHFGELEVGPPCRGKYVALRFLTSLNINSLLRGTNLFLFFDIPRDAEYTSNSRFSRRWFLTISILAACSALESVDISWELSWRLPRGRFVILLNAATA